MDDTTGRKNENIRQAVPFVRQITQDGKPKLEVYRPTTNPIYIYTQVSVFVFYLSNQNGNFVYELRRFIETDDVSDGYLITHILLEVLKVLLFRTKTNVEQIIGISKHMLSFVSCLVSVYAYRTQIVVCA